MGNVVVLLVITSILAISISKVVSDKRKGVKCMGCSHSKACPSRNSLSKDILGEGPAHEGTISKCK